MLEAQNGLFDGQAPIYDKPFLKSKESGTVILARENCKYLDRGADEKSGCHGNCVLFTNDFLDRNDFTLLPLELFRGSRCNILHENAANLYFLALKAVEFL